MAETIAYQPIPRQQFLQDLEQRTRQAEAGGPLDGSDAIYAQTLIRRVLMGRIELQPPIDSETRHSLNAIQTRLEQVLR